jgi:hypothetical protein
VKEGLWRTVMDVAGNRERSESYKTVGASLAHALKDVISIHEAVSGR